MILPHSISHWPPKWAELFSERAAIMEFDGGLTRAAAELAAEKDIRELASKESRRLTIKVISLWEPWATAMRRKLKKNETRSWDTRYRGWLAIHAAKQEYRPRDYPNEFSQMVQGAGIWPHHLSTTYGHVLCIAKLMGCEKTETVAGQVSEREREWGDYSGNRYAWITCPNNMIELEHPVPLRGRQGLFDWEVTPEVIGQKHFDLLASKEPEEALGQYGLQLNFPK